jgi:hypothetical protein
MRPEQKFCRILPNTDHFIRLLWTRQPRNVFPIPTCPNTPVNETIDQNTLAVFADSISDGLVFNIGEDEEI